MPHSPDEVLDPITAASKWWPDSPFGGALASLTTQITTISDRLDSLASKQAALDARVAALEAAAKPKK